MHEDALGRDNSLQLSAAFWDLRWRVPHMALIRLRVELEKAIAATMTAVNKELPRDESVDLTAAMEAIACHLYAEADRRATKADEDDMVLSGWLDVELNGNQGQVSGLVDWTVAASGPLATEQQSWTTLADWMGGSIELAAPVVAALAPAIPAGVLPQDWLAKLKRSDLEELLRNAGLHGLTSTVWAGMERLRKASAGRRPSTAEADLELQPKPAAAASTSVPARAPTVPPPNGDGSGALPDGLPEALRPLFAVADVNGSLAFRELEACLSVRSVERHRTTSPHRRHPATLDATDGATDGAASCGERRALGCVSRCLRWRWRRSRHKRRWRSLAGGRRCTCARERSSRPR